MFFLEGVKNPTHAFSAISLHAERVLLGRCETFDYFAHRNAVRSVSRANAIRFKGHAFLERNDDDQIDRLHRDVRLGSQPLDPLRRERSIAPIACDQGVCQCIERAAVVEDRLASPQCLQSSLVVKDQLQLLSRSHRLESGNKPQSFPKDPKRLGFDTSVRNHLCEIVRKSRFSRRLRPGNRYPHAWNGIAADGEARLKDHFSVHDRSSSK